MLRRKKRVVKICKEMKYAIISDIHSNPKALETVLSDAWEQDAEKVICLGDVVGYGPDPSGAIKLVRETCDVVLMGNHDATVAGLRSLDGLIGSAADGDRRDRGRLSQQDIDWLASLPYAYSGDGFDCAHGSFADAERIFYTNDAFDAKTSLRISNAQFQFVGHTHVSAVWNWDKYLWDRFPDPRVEGAFVADPEHRYVVNVGSVGYPRVENDSVYALFDSATGTVELRRLPFDYETYAADLRSNGVELPFWLDEHLRRWP